MSSHFVWVNRSKESLSLDLKSSEGLDVLFQLGVLVQNLAPGAAARMGLSFEELHQRYPGLIVCDISGYGHGGPLQDKKSYDLLIQSKSGFLSVTGTPDPEGMVKAGCSVADIAAGMYAQSNILSALLLRGRTGKGSRRCWRVWWSGWGIPCTTALMTQSRHPGRVHPMLRYFTMDRFRSVMAIPLCWGCRMIRNGGSSVSKF
jgi:hypothetical protein